MIIIYITNPSKEVAKELAKYLLDEGLIACANIFPVQSMYRGKEKLEEGEEFILLAKTKDALFEKVKESVLEKHPYEVPCILKLNVEANKEYEDWLNSITI
ncbi:MAG: divalent-cation tolerance protein CutA [Candidatus Nanoarchaeia archaeon]